MRPTLLAACVLLSAPVRAQTVAALAAKHPEGASAALAQEIAALSEPKLVLPTWKEVQQDRLRRDLTSLDGSSSAPAAPGVGLVDRQPPNGVLRARRFTRETLDVQFLRPLPRVELGLGWTEVGVDDGSRATGARTGDDAHAFLRVDLSRIAAPRRPLHSPTFVHERSEVSADRSAAARDDYDVHSRP
jgi:hypothetical protein